MGYRVMKHLTPPPCFRRTPRPIFVEPCDELASGDDNKWDDSGLTNCSLTLSEDFAQCGVASIAAYGDNPSALKIVPGVAVAYFDNIPIVYNPAKDLSAAKFITMDIYVEEGSGDTAYSTLANLLLYVYSGAGDYRIYRFLGSSNLLRHGQYRLVAPITSFHSETGALNWAAVNKMKLWGFATAGKQPSIHVDRIMFTAGREAAKTSLKVFTFDDGRVNQWSFASLLNAYGIPGTFVVQSEHVGEATKLTADQLVQMRDYGHLIGNHWNYSAGYASATTAERLAGYLAAVDWMESHGFVEGARIFRPPGGLRSYDDIIAMTKYVQCWLMTNAPGSATANAYKFSEYGQGLEIFNSVYDNTTLAASLWTSALANSGVLITGWHDVSDFVAGDWASFKAHVAAVAADVAAGNAECRVVSEIGR